MTDAISRSALINDLKAVKFRGEPYGDADIDALYQTIKDIHYGIMHLIETAPSLNVAPVVRCNRCKYYEQDTGFCRYFGCGNHWDGFCNKGARMDGEENAAE